jgi:protein O-GlcNAc transferase
MLQSIDTKEEARDLRKQGNSLAQNNQPAAALDCFERSLRLAPGDALTLNDRGNALQDLQRLEEALSSYDRALSIQPEFPAALTNRSNVFRTMRRLDEALRDLDAALRVRPAFPEALNNRGNVLRDMRRLREALASFDAALALKPGFIVAQCNRGNTLLDLGLYAQALACFEAVLAVVPQEGEALFGRALALLNLRQLLEEAVAGFDRAAACGLDRVESLVGKSAALAQLKRHSEAAACLAQVLALAPHRDYVLGSLLYSRLQAVDWSGYFQLVESLVGRVSAGQKATYPLSLLPVVDSPELSLRGARLHVEHQYPPTDLPAPVRVRRERIRIAYLSGDFRDHPVAHLLVGVLEHHDRQRFEVLGVALRAGDGSDIERRIVAAFDRLIDVGTRSDREVAEL